MTMIPRIVIAGTHSGCGKTTVATGLMAALVARGLRVQPFKVGPDFIDPSHHTRICSRTSRNLDAFMMGEDGVRDTFLQACAGADIAVIEGVMGMYDGIDGTACASTAHIAKLLDAPVILVVDARGMSRSAQALINGFRAYDPDIRIAGVIFNRIGSERHRQMIGNSHMVPSFGWIPRHDDLAITSRHLGLKMAHETAVTEEFGNIIAQHCDLDAVISAAQDAPIIDATQAKVMKRKVRATIGVAWDAAFCFYYQDNFDRLRSAGAELVFFSPLSDRLPDIVGIYLGGGYPELHLEGLETSACNADIRQAIDGGMPVYGECGGLMYLTKEVTTDRSYRLCGVLPAITEMTEKVQALGYVQGQSNARSSYLPSNLPMVGHEFHYSRVVPYHDARYAFRLSRGKGIENGQDGLILNNAIGTYTHAYFSERFATAFVTQAVKYNMP